MAREPGAPVMRLAPALLFLAACSCGPRVLMVPVPVVIAPLSADDLARDAGVSFCMEPREASFSLIRDSLDATEDAAVRAHETRHRAQFARYPSCEVFDSVYRTDAGYVWTEAEASAAQFCVMRARGVDSAAAYRDMADRIVTQGGWRLHPTSTWDAMQAMNHFLPCPARDGPSRLTVSR